MRKHQISDATKAWHSILAFLLIVMFTFGFEGIVVAQTSKSTAVKNIVVVHGAFADGSGWEGVRYRRFLSVHGAIAKHYKVDPAKLQESASGR